MDRDRVEILAPAGSYDIMTAVINAGADAVYLGGECFGARAFAGNFNKEELLRTIEYAHIHGKKIYLTVNTLLKENEIGDRLITYLTPYYEAGLDAVIVQDMGVFKLIHETFPDLAIHASTQMAITGSNGAKILENMGATRVVTARELKASEIRAIKDTCDVEIESFVHGALCYCYSGQCLLSSMNGGRSGNRGRCAQPCRLAYDVKDLDGNSLNDRSSAYVLSPRDMCALSILPDVIEAGVYSLKIEGRMKNVSYAAGVTAMYRKYVDLYLEKGRKGYKVEDEDIRILMDLFNRGAFTTGYYDSTKGMEMMSVKRPNHMGTKALRVLDNKNGCVRFQALEKINPQDVFEIDSENSFASGKTYMTGETFEVNLPRKYRLNQGMELYRMKNGAIAASVNEMYVQKNIKAPIDLFFEAELGRKSQLVMTHKVTGVCAAVEGDEVQGALKQPATQEKIAAQLSKLGDTLFAVDDVTVNLAGDVFLPVGQINELRRNCIEKLEEEIRRFYHRTVNIDVNSDVITEQDADTGRVSCEQQDSYSEIDEQDQNIQSYSAASKSILVSTVKQAEEALKQKDSDGDQVDMIYYEYSILADALDQSSEQAEGMINACHKAGKQAILALPHVFTQKHVRKLSTLIEQSSSAGIDGFLIRNMEQIGVISRMHAENPDRISNRIVTDAVMYVWNSTAFRQFMMLAKENGLELVKVTLPYELTSDEITMMTEAARGQGVKLELVVRTHIPVMISEQCVRKTLGCCKKTGSKKIAGDAVVMTDKKKQEYIIKNKCDYCYSVMYDSEILNISDMKDEITEVAPDSIRFELIDESEQVCNVLYADGISGSNGRGHFILGVE